MNTNLKSLTSWRFWFFLIVSLFCLFLVLKYSGQKIDAPHYRVAIQEPNFLSAKEVESIQRLLQFLGYKTVVINGKLDANTAEAMRKEFFIRYEFKRKETNVTVRKNKSSK